MASLEGLYALPLSEFTSARNDLAKALAEKGAEAEAASVKALRKPTLPVWALNQAVRRAPDELERLLESVDRLRDATEAGDRDALNSASAERKGALAGLKTAAREALEEAGHTAGGPQLEQVVQLLLTASTDDSVRDELQAGALRTEPEMSPFGAGATLEVVSDPGGAEADAEKAQDELRRKVERLDREAKAAESEAIALEAEAERAEGAARKARGVARRARKRAEAARSKADEALGAG